MLDGENRELQRAASSFSSSSADFAPLRKKQKKEAGLALGFAARLCSRVNWIFPQDSDGWKTHRKHDIIIIIITNSILDGRACLIVFGWLSGAREGGEGPGRAAGGVIPC